MWKGLIYFQEPPQRRFWLELTGFLLFCKWASGERDIDHTQR